MADKNTQRALAVLTGLNRPTYTMWPVFTGAPAAGIVLTPAAGAWGALADIIAASAITEEFWVTKCCFSVGAVGFGLHEIEVQNTTSTTVFYRCRVDITGVNVNLPPFKIPIPSWNAPNAQIQARTGAGAAADLISLSLLVATGL